MDQFALVSFLILTHSQVYFERLQLLYDQSLEKVNVSSLYNGRLQSMLTTLCKGLLSPIKLPVNIREIIIHQIFPLARDWSKRVTWPNTGEYPRLFFSQASERAGFPNPRIWLANHLHGTGPAIYDPDGPRAGFFSRSTLYLNFSLES